MSPVKNLHDWVDSKKQQKINYFNLGQKIITKWGSFDNFWFQSGETLFKSGISQLYQHIDDKNLIKIEKKLTYAKHIVFLLIILG